ncbi:MAG: VCBS repeat-containing protein [Candidatus Auribacterota bacterium]|nr:VCBS repeat-containing protein [Candidatus Auribacterota bacterium]
MIFKKALIILFTFALLVPIFSAAASEKLWTAQTCTVIRQEFTWQTGCFQTVYLSVVGETPDCIEWNNCTVLHCGAAGSGSLVGSSLDYEYWDTAKNQWATLTYCGPFAAEAIRRWGGKDNTDECKVTRYDNIFYGLKDNDTYNVPIAFEPVVEVKLANDWTLDLAQSYNEWGHSLKITHPGGASSYIWGDPHLLQKGGTQQQELAAVGNYVFDLGGYTLDFSCMRQYAGFSFVNDWSLSGPNNYVLTVGRNGEVKRSGGTGGAVGDRPDRIYYHTVPVDGITLHSDTVYVRVESNGSLTGAMLDWNGMTYPMTGSGRTWSIRRDSLSYGTYYYLVTGTDGTDDFITGGRSVILAATTTPTPSVTPTPSSSPTPTPIIISTPSPTPSVTPTPTCGPTVPPPTATPYPTLEYLVLESGDYDGDGISDIAVFRPDTGLWAVRGLGRTYFGTAGDVPVSGDYDGDGITDVSIFRPSNGLWAVKQLTRLYFGGSDDIPVPGDYDGDGTCDLAVFGETTGRWAVKEFTRVYFGALNDLPVPGDFEGSGIASIGIFRPSSGLWAIRGLTRLYFGGSGDCPVAGVYQWYGAGKAAGSFRTQAAIFRPAIGLWALRGVTRIYFGADGDSPVIGDFTGDALDEFGIFRASSGLWTIQGVTRVYFGSSSDIPVTR